MREADGRGRPKLLQKILGGHYANRIAFAFGVTALTGTTLGVGLGGFALPAFVGATAVAPSLGRRLGRIKKLDAFRGHFALTLTLLCATATVVLGPTAPLALFLATGGLQTITGLKYLAEQHSGREYKPRRQDPISRFLRGDFANRVLVGYGLGGIAAIATGSPLFAALGSVAGASASQKIGERMAPVTNRMNGGPTGMFFLAVSLTMFSGMFILGGAAPATLPLAVRAMMGITGLKFLTENAQHQPLVSPSDLKGRGGLSQQRGRGKTAGTLSSPSLTLATPAVQTRGGRGRALA